MNTLNAVWGTAADNVYVVGNGGTILHRSLANGPWSPEGSATQFIAGVWGSGNSDVYAVGAGGAIWHSTGRGDWVQQASTTTSDLEGVWGSDSGNVYAVTRDGSIVRSNGTSWRAPVSSGGSSLVAVWGSSANDVYVAGFNDPFKSLSGVIFHSTGNDSWSPRFSQPDYYAVGCLWGSGSSELFACKAKIGDPFASEPLLHSVDGMNWISTEINPSNYFHAISGTGPADVYAVGEKGTVLRTTDGGKTWAFDNSKTTNDLRGVWAAPNGELFAVGMMGTILHHP